MSEVKERDFGVAEVRVERRVSVSISLDIAIDAEGPKLRAAVMVREAGTIESASVSSVGSLIVGARVDVRSFPASAIEIKSPRS